MNVSTMPLRWAAIAGLVLCLSGGCMRATRPENFYTLSSMTRSTATIVSSAASESAWLIGIGPVQLPDALKRPQIVTRIDRNRLEMAEFDRWAGPLEREISRVMAENLSLLLGTDRVVQYPWPASTQPTHRVDLEIRRFDGRPGQEVALNVTWTVRATTPGASQVSRKSVLSEPVDDGGYPSLVAAQSRLLEALGRQIATALETLAK